MKNRPSKTQRNSDKPKKCPPLKQKFPPGWDEDRVKRVIAHYENLSEEELLAEDEAAFAAPGETLISVPSELIPAVLKLIARSKVKNPGRKKIPARSIRQGIPR